MTTTTATETWAMRAEAAQDDLDHFFGAEWPQYLENFHPAGDNSTFNYWWLAHVIDVRLDAFARSGDERRLEQAVAAYRNILERNGGSLFNDYFDDMLWYALAILRLHEATGDQRYLDDAQAIWDHIVEHGWNDTLGESVAWRKQQPYYKNTPANGPFVILSARLSDIDDSRPYLDYARRAFDWLTATLVDPQTGFVEDGINRAEDGLIDRHWRFTYNQGLYIGAAVEMARILGAEVALGVASKTAVHAIETLATDGVFRGEGDGNDEGLFKGVYYRYAGLLIDRLPVGDVVRAPLVAFVESSTDALWANGYRDGHLLVGDDWAAPLDGQTRYSTQLSAIMALELRARLAA